MGSDFCFPLAKYSHAIGLRDGKTVPWNHITSSNLFIIVKGVDKDTKDETLTLRVVQASDVLESLDVGSYIDRAVGARRTVESTGTTLYVEQLPIFGMTKGTILAVRYTMSDGQARRLQMRMHSAAECRQIVHAFESRGMEFMEQRPTTAGSVTSRPATVGSPATAYQSGSPYFQVSQPPARSSFNPAVVEAGSLSRNRPVSAERPLTNTSVSFPAKNQNPQEMRRPKLLAHEKTSAPRDVAPNRPSTTQIYRSTTIQAPCSGFDANDIVHQAKKDGLARPSSTSNTAGAEALSQAVEDCQSSLGAAVNATEWIDVEAGLSSVGNSAKAGQMAARPSTASSFVFADTLEHEIPPRRELPFVRPDSRKGGSSGSAARPRSALTLPPLPKPKLSSQNSSSSTVGKELTPLSPNRPLTSSPLKRPFTEGDQSTKQSNRPLTASATRNTSPVRASSPQAPPKKPSRMEELLHDRKVSLERSSASKYKRTDSLADAPGEEDDSPLQNDQSTGKPPDRHDSVSPVRRTAPDTDVIANAYAAISTFRQQDGGLQQYAEQSLEDRQAALEEFMMQNLEDPAFTTLCRDVENCWRRIALGL